jgi:pyruvate/2-oxoglutarate dehydrogenase complex dihydrolipoamide dehydrogenase (E3) component
VGKVPMKATLRTRAVSETRGFLKVLISQADDRILGFAGFGVSAGETMAAIQVAMKANLTCQDMRDMIIAHPTFAEGIISLFSSVPPK